MGLPLTVLLLPSFPFRNPSLAILSVMRAVSTAFWEERAATHQSSSYVPRSRGSSPSVDLRDKSLLTSAAKAVLDYYCCNRHLPGFGTFSASSFEGAIIFLIEASLVVVCCKTGLPILTLTIAQRAFYTTHDDKCSCYTA